MNDSKLTTLGDLKQFVSGTNGVDFKPLSQNGRYRWLGRTLKRFDYHRLRKKDKGLVIKYMCKMTGYSRQQITRLIAQHRETGWIGRRQKPRNTFPRKYTQKDIQLLAEVDKYHNVLSGPATKKLLERSYEVFKEDEYERLADISSAHIYNLRKSRSYLLKSRHFTKTKRTTVSIAERRKPEPNGKPGYLRIDTVHQGDKDKEKGVYHINAVCEVTQMEVICSVEKISERYLIPVLEQIINDFPFEVKGIHADNGSEYINHVVARLLKKLLIEFTKSRSRHTNDNALVEGKNGALVRKHLGYTHIQQRWAPTINQFFKEYLNPYINYHRPCYFPVSKIDRKGKERKRYPYSSMMTPYDKLKSLPDAERFLKAGVTFDLLDAFASKMTDLQAAKKMHKARTELFKKIDQESFSASGKLQNLCQTLSLTQ